MAQTVSLGAALPAVDFDVAMEVASHEALIRQTHKDSVGKLTWCVGMTNATGHKVERYVGKPASLQHCMNIYAWALGNYAAGVHRAFKGHNITKAQFAAALSFHWNTGEIETAGWVKLWRAGDVAGAKKAIMHWVTPPEIAGRRKKERDLFFDGKWSNDGRMTEYTQLTAKMTPMWSSAVKVDVSVELRKAFAKPVPVKLDVPMQPDAPVEVPTLSRARGESWAHQ
jgi:GH24 family phage-related lysozyme (muramidase)